MARTFQNLGLFPSLTFLENTMAGAQPWGRVGFRRASTRLGVRKEENTLRREAYELLELLGLESLAFSTAADQPFGTLKRSSPAAFRWTGHALEPPVGRTDTRKSRSYVHGGPHTMERRFACLVGDLDTGESMRLAWEPPVALFRNDEGEFYATADTCTHEQWSLGEDSELEGNEVVCPLHLAHFDIRTGAALCFPATVALQTFAVEIDPDEKVYVIA